MKRLVLLFGLLYAALTPAWAGTSFPPSPWTSKESYTEKITHKFGFGFLNFSSGWTSIFFELAKDQNKLKGLARGAALTVSDTAGGAIHLVTFFLPVDVPLPEGGLSAEYQ